MAFVRLELDVNGVAEVNKAIEEYGEEAFEGIKSVLLENAKQIALKAKSRAPMGRTGNLKRGIRFGFAKGQGPLAVRVYTATRYAPYQEFGTGTGARPYVPTLPTELQKLAARYRGQGGENPNITPKKFLWNSTVDQQPLIIRSVQKKIELLDLYR